MSNRDPYSDSGRTEPDQYALRLDVQIVNMIHTRNDFFNK